MSHKNINSWNIDIYIVTWNVSSKYPDSSPLTNLLGLEKNPVNDQHQPDFYVIGLQEVNAQPQNVVMGLFKDDPWTQRFKEILKDRDYIAVKSEQMQGMLLILFAKRKHILHLRQIETEYTRTGLGGIWGNKGAISIRLSLYGCAVSIVNAHLAAHDHMLDERVVDYNQILDNHHYHVKMYREIFDHDYVFWFGDLNFRLNGEHETTPQDIRQMVQDDKLSDLLERDQLTQVRTQGRAFKQLTERIPAFAPTFKFERGTSNYDMKRRPAWCDRILYNVKPDAYQNVMLSVEQTSYKSHPGYVISDHKPVTSEFVIKFVKTKAEFLKTLKKEPDSKHPEIRRTDPTIMQRIYSDPSEKIIKFSPIEEWLIDGENTIEYSIPEGLKEYPGSDWIGLFRKDFDDLTKYIAYLYVPKSHSDPLDNPEPRPSETIRRLQMDFSENNVNIMDGETYLLIYFQREESGPTGIVGISNCFRAIREKEGEVIKSHNRGLHCHLPSCLPQHEHQHDN